MLDNLLPVFQSVCVCNHMCEHSLQGQVLELSAQRGVSGVLVDQLSEPWWLSSSFIITVLKDHSKRKNSLPLVI